MAAKYDADSGQVFTESTCSVLPMRPDWTQCRKVLGRSEAEERPFLNWTLQDKERTRKMIDAKKRLANGTGTFKLVEICIRVCTDNLDRLSLPILRELPVHLGRRIYDVAVDRNRLSLNFWKAYIRAYHPFPANDDDDMHRFTQDKARSVYLAHLSQQDFSLPLRTHVTYTVSQSCEWLSTISIHHRRPDLADFMSLADLPNLVFLQLKGVDTFNEEILRAWSQRITESDGSAFPKLRIFTSDSVRATKLCFDYLGAFPALYAFSVSAYYDGCQYSKVRSWECISKPNSINADYRKRLGTYERELLQKFLSLDLGEIPQLFLHQGIPWRLAHGLSLFRLLDRPGIESLLRDYSAKGLLEEEWAKRRWWFRSNSTMKIAEACETPKEAQAASRRSTVVAPAKMKEIGNILGDLM